MNSMTRVSGSVLAMTAAGALPAVAQDALSGFTLDVKAGYGTTSNLMADKLGNDEIPDGDEIADKLGLDDDKGFFGSVRVKRSFNDWADYSVGISGASLSDDGGDREAATVLDIEDSFRTFAFDADIGWNTSAGAFPVRVFGGLRVAQITSEIDKIGTSGSDSARFNTETSFLGVGPRLGAEMGGRFNPSSNFGWSGAVAGSMLFGSLDTDIETSSSFGSDASIGFDESTTIYNIDANLGIDWYINETNKVSVGYQAQKYWNVSPDIIGLFSGDDDNLDRLVHGAYLGYTTSF